jgi:sugar phosphate permease
MHMLQHQHLLAAPEQHIEAAGFILRGIRGVFALIGSVIAGVICAVVAKSKGYSAILFGVLGLIFSLITLLVVLVIPRRR